MTNFEKILLPLVVENISKEDICPESGFIDTYTVDVDRPSWQNEFFSCDSLWNLRLTLWGAFKLLFSTYLWTRDFNKIWQVCAF